MFGDVFGLLISKIRKSYARLFESVLDGRVLYCFGAGSLMKNILRGFKYRDKLAGILDNDESKWGYKLNGVVILSPETLCREDSKRIVVLITTDYFEQIESQLESLGIQYVFFYPLIATHIMNICSGNYRTWNMARNDCRGYDHGLILEKVKAASLKVINGEAVFERDSVLFYDQEYNFNMIASLLYVYAHEGSLSVIDFGGSLGSTYFQNKRVLPDLELTKWNIIEQADFVACGKELISSREKRVKFFKSADQINFRSCNCLILSSSIEYVEDPYACLRSLLDLGCKYILLDKMPLIEGEDRLCIQATPLGIYDADYPLWLLNRDKFMKVLQENYETVFKWEMESNLWLADDETEAVCRGCLLRAR